MQADSLPIRFVHHLSIVVRNAAASEAFYRQVLGFRALNRPAFNFRGAWLYRGEIQIHIIERPEPPLAAGAENAAGEAAIDPRANHIAFSVESIATARSVLQSHEVRFREQVNAGGVRQLFFHDPDGHHIELAEYGHPSQEMA